MAGPVVNGPGPESLQPGGTGEPRAAQPGYTPSPDEQVLIRLVTDRIGYTGRDSARWALERQAFENLCFYGGIQWIEYTESSRRYSRWSAPSWMPTPVTNLIAPRANQMMAAFAKVDPKGKVRPNSNEPKDREAAKTSDTLLTHAYEVVKERKIRMRAQQLAVLTGTAIAEDYYNPRAGKMLRIPRQTITEQPIMEPTAHCPQCNTDDPNAPAGLPCPNCGTPTEPGQRARLTPDGQPMTMPQVMPEIDPDTGDPIVDEVPEGELASRVRGQFNFYWDPKAVDLDEARWCGEAVYVDLDWVDENFPDMGPFVPAESGVDGASFFETSLLSLVGPSVQGTAHYGGGQYLTHGCMLRKYEEKPSRKYPRGLKLIIANGVLLYQGDLPIQDENGYPTGDFSYTLLKFDEIPGRLLGRTPVEDMVPLQRRVNGIDAQIIINRKTLLNPWILAPKGSGLNPGSVAMRPGAVILYNFIGVGQAPQVVQGTALPAQVLQEREQAIQAMTELAQDASAVPTMPENMRSGLQLHYMREQVEEQGKPRLQRYGDWVAERDRKRLLLMQRHYHEDRAVKIMGEGSEWQVRYFSGADISGATDVYIDPGSLVPRSASIKNQLIFDAIEAGIVDPKDPLDRQRLIEELQLQAFEPPSGPDYRRALKENALLAEGTPVSVNPQDTHETHIPIHTGQMQDPAYDQWPPQAQQAMQQHLQMHQQAQALAQEQSKQDYLKDEQEQLDMEARAKGMQTNFKRARQQAAVFGGTPPAPAIGMDTPASADNGGPPQ